MKRLVICCDSTWHRYDSPVISNIEKIARTVQTEPDLGDGVTQLVYYVSGVGTAGFRADTVLGGLVGLGLLNNVLAGYRFLAQNYVPGDEIYVFGFSRGAFTARSLVGMISDVGLITKWALVDEQLPVARDFYEARRKGDSRRFAALQDWRRAYCHRSAPVHFAGVFDTVGALGVPAFGFFAPRFHDVQLSDAVRCARHALAIDERRLTYEPTVWTTGGDGPGTDPRVKQVWFPGVHEEVGGGLVETAYADTSLLWMVTEAARQGLVFDTSLLATYVASGTPAARTRPLGVWRRLINLVVRAGEAITFSRDEAIEDGLRRLSRPGYVSIRVASTAAEDFAAGTYRPANMASLAATTNGFEGIVEPVERLPKADRNEALALLEPLVPPARRVAREERASR